MTKHNLIQIYVIITKEYISTMHCTGRNRITSDSEYYNALRVH